MINFFSVLDDMKTSYQEKTELLDKTKEFQDLMKKLCSNVSSLQYEMYKSFVIQCLIGFRQVIKNGEDFIKVEVLPGKTFQDMINEALKMGK